MRSPLPNSCIIAAALCVSTAAANPLEAQARSKPLAQTSVSTTSIYACYVPVAGLVYIIKEPGIAQACLSLGPIQHAQISWDRVGPKGDKGAAGDAGPAGNPGPQGAAGDKGAVGPAGTQGPAGDKGATGDTGPPGDAGAVGDKGPAGDKGATGDPGAAGDKGEVGDKGPPGEQGAVGDKGLVGDAGAAGEKGPAGDKGPTGDNGEVGNKGEAGDKGAVGDKGPVGLKGLTGDKGSIGEAGPDGANLPCNDGCVTTPIIADLAVTNAKLATISAPGRILNSATTATSANLASRIVGRDAAGGFIAGSVTLTDLNLFGVGAQVFHGTVSRLLYNVHPSSPALASIYFGVGAGTSASFTPSQHVGVGTGAHRATTGGGSTAVGFEALNGGSSFGATVIGAFAVDNGLFPGERHVAIGWRAGRAMTGDGPSLARRNIVIGPEAGTNLFTHANVVAIGRATVTGSSATNIGTEGTHLRTFVAGIDNSTISGIPVMVSTAGQLGVAVSSARFKVGVRDIGDASSVLNALRPVSYRYRRDLDRLGVSQYGLIAEEVDRVAPSLVARDSTERPYSVRYEMIVPLLVNEVQLRRTRLAELQAQSARIRVRVEQLEATAKP